MTTGFQNQLSPQMSQSFQDLYRSGNYSGAYNLTAPLAPKTSTGFGSTGWGPNYSTYADQDNIFNQYLSFFGLQDSGITDVLSGNPPEQQQPPLNQAPEPPEEDDPPGQQQPPQSGNDGGIDFGDNADGDFGGWPIDDIDFDPELAYGTFLRENFQGNPGDMRFLQSRFNDVYGQYSNELGDQFTNAGQFPETTFYREWLPQNINPQDYLRNFNPEDRGQGTSQFNPRTSFNFGSAR